MLWVTLVYHPYRFAGRVETAPEAVSVFIGVQTLITNVFMDLQFLPPCPDGHALEVDPTCGSWPRLSFP